MKTPEQEILTACRRWLSAGHNIWLATIVRSSGSSPRPLGAMLACDDSGAQIGSLSGGCIEEDLLAQVRDRTLATDKLALIEYGITAEQNERLGLPCGGRLEVLIEPLQSNASAELDALLHAIENRQRMLRSVDLDSGNTELASSPHFTPLAITETKMTRCFGPRSRMLLVGAGQLAQSLSELAMAMDYEVLVTDPREHMLEQWQGPDLPLLPGMPDDILLQYANDRHSAIITLTHDPRIDDMALLEALQTDAWYIGALGSKRTTGKRKRRLQELGITDAQLERLHAPVGLDIGSKTPVEIAVSIMAQLIALRGRQ